MSARPAPPGRGNRILLAEDEARIASFIEKGLRAVGFVVHSVADGNAAYAEARSGAYDLLILDIGLPGIDGFSLLHRLRTERVSLPVLILTARDSVADRVAGLEGGADDYLSKPFAFEELLARVRLRSRDNGSVVENTLVRVGDLTLDVRTRRVTAGQRKVELSAREFTLAETLARHAGQVLSREQLLSQVWGLDFDPGSNVVDVYIRYLRRKLGAHRLETVRGVGYRMRTDPE